MSPMGPTMSEVGYRQGYEAGKQVVEIELRQLREQVRALVEAARTFYVSIEQEEGYCPAIYDGQEDLRAALRALEEREEKP